MKIVIPDDYQDIADKLPCFALIRHHEVTRYTDAAHDLDTLAARFADADVIVSIRERPPLSRALLERLPKLKLIALLGRTAASIDFAACTARGIPVATGVSNSPDSPAEHTIALMLSARRNITREAEGMKRGALPSTVAHRLNGSTLGVFGLGAIGERVAAAGKGTRPWPEVTRAVPRGPQPLATELEHSRARSARNLGIPGAGGGLGWFRGRSRLR